MNSVYGFREEDDDGDDAIDRETVQKDHRALNKLKRNVDEIRESMRDIAKLKSDVVLLNTDVAGLKRDTWRIKKIAKIDIEEFKSELVFREVLESDNIIVAEASKDESYVCAGDLSGPRSVILFNHFDKITKLKGNLFHFGDRDRTHIILLNTVNALKDARIRISIILRIIIVIKLNYPDGEVIFYLARNRDEGPENAVLSNIFDTSLISEAPHSSTQLLTLTGDIDMKSADELAPFL